MTEEERRVSYNNAMLRHAQLVRILDTRYITSSQRQAALRSIKSIRYTLDRMKTSNATEKMYVYWLTHGTER